MFHTCCEVHFGVWETGMEPPLDMAHLYCCVARGQAGAKTPVSLVHFKGMTTKLYAGGRIGGLSLIEL
jgi:hypothetical protein